MRHFIVLIGFGLVGLGSFGCGEGEKNSATVTAKSIGSESPKAAKKGATDDGGRGDVNLATDSEPAFDIGSSRGPDAKGKDAKEGSSGSTSSPKAESPDVGPFSPSDPVPSSTPGVAVGPLAGSKKSEVAAKSDPGLADPVAGTATRPKKKSEPVPPAGILTAGSFDDNLDPLVFASFTRRFDAARWQDQLPMKLSGTRVQVLVKDAAGRPVGGAKVRLFATKSPAAEEVMTRTLGQATFVLTWDGLPTNQELTVLVTPPDGAPAVSDKIPVGAPRWEVTLPATQAKLPKNLDLAFVFDTTGSMGDELKYLLGEFKGISADIKARFPEVNQRLGLVLYRDFGDEYLTRMFDFTNSVDEFHRNLSKQSASGGGDTPEAVHKGLEQVQQLRWRSDADTVRIVFLIGDAPPHTQHMNATMKAVNILRKDGIAIYPVACSGYDDPCELIWRASAVLTSSQFLFLTDDSGVGGAHAEPKIPFYQVEHLNKMMVRMIASELTGDRLQPLPADVIRTVGRKIN